MHTSKSCNHNYNLRQRPIIKFLDEYKGQEQKSNAKLKTQNKQPDHVNIIVYTITDQFRDNV